MQRSKIFYFFHLLVLCTPNTMRTREKREKENKREKRKGKKRKGKERIGNKCLW